MNRTLRAAVVAALVGFAAVAGFGWMLGFPVGSSVVAGVVAAVLFAGIVLAAARRSGNFHDPGGPQ
jgi:hypothetical protein